MNRKSAAKLFEQHGLKLLRWNGSFTIATLRTDKGETVEIHADGDRSRMLKRLKPYQKASPKTEPSADAPVPPRA